MHRRARPAPLGPLGLGLLGLLPSLLLGLVLLAPGTARGADDAPPNPFRELATRLRLGRTVRLRGAIVVTLQLSEAHQVQQPAHVGLGGAKTRILPLPGPAGLWHVRIANEGDEPLLVPAGDTILTPLQASRSTDRAVWIAPGAATFVPVVQAEGGPSQGPYVARGRGLTPFEQSMIPPDRWAERVAARNRQFAVVGARGNDAAAVYVTDAFAAIRQADGKLLDAAVAAPTTVGIFVADDRGPFYAHIQTDAERFRQHWPFLRDGILLDAHMLQQVGGTPRPGDEGELRKTLWTLLRALGTKPLNRPNFGEGWEYRWPLSDPPGHWDGLGTAAGGICLRLYRYPLRPAGAPPPPGTGGTPRRCPIPRSSKWTGARGPRNSRSATANVARAWASATSLRHRPPARRSGRASRPRPTGRMRIRRPPQPPVVQPPVVQPPRPQAPQPRVPPTTPPSRSPGSQLPGRR